MAQAQLKKQKSKVQYVNYNTERLRKLFDYLREREEVLQLCLLRELDQVQLIATKAALYETQSLLMWMVTNIHRRLEKE